VSVAGHARRTRRLQCPTRCSGALLPPIWPITAAGVIGEQLDRVRLRGQRAGRLVLADLRRRTDVVAGLGDAGQQRPEVLLGTDVPGDEQDRGTEVVLGAWPRNRRRPRGRGAVGGAPAARRRWAWSARSSGVMPPFAGYRNDLFEQWRRRAPARPRRRHQPASSAARSCMARSSSTSAQSPPSAGPVIACRGGASAQTPELAHPLRPERLVGAGPGRSPGGARQRRPRPWSRRRRGARRRSIRGTASRAVRARMASTAPTTPARAGPVARRDDRPGADPLDCLPDEGTERAGFLDRHAAEPDVDRGGAAVEEGGELAGRRPHPAGVQEPVAADPRRARPVVGAGSTCSLKACSTGVAVLVALPARLPLPWERSGLCRPGRRGKAGLGPPAVDVPGGTTAPSCVVATG